MFSVNILLIQAKSLKCCYVTDRIENASFQTDQSLLTKDLTITHHICLFGAIGTSPVYFVFHSTHRLAVTGFRPRLRLVPHGAEMHLQSEPTVIDVDWQLFWCSAA